MLSPLNSLSALYSFIFQDGEEILGIGDQVHLAFFYKKKQQKNYTD